MSATIRSITTATSGTITRIVLGIMTVYHTFVSPLLHQILGVKTACRHTPSCSVYAHTAIEQYGISKGSLLAFRRFLNCQPFIKI